MQPDVADLTLPKEDRRELIRWTAVCVERLLPLFEADRPADPRLAAALDGARQFATGHLSVGPMRQLAFGCHAAAREATTIPATAVARAFGQAVAVAHMAGHSREISRYTSQAIAGEGTDSGTAMAADTPTCSLPRVRLRQRRAALRPIRDGAPGHEASQSAVGTLVESVGRHLDRVAAVGWKMHLDTVVERSWCLGRWDGSVEARPVCE